jgi:mitogen-activated protein kinase kinase 1
MLLSWLPTLFLRALLQIRVVPEPYLAELTRQMLLGLSFLHDTARICHRDVKPSNLLLSSRGQLKISDFGTSSQLSNSMSRCLSWVGTVTYMSPERIRGDSYGFNTDVWSLGLLVLECAVGRYPYPPQQQGASDGGGAAAAAAVAPKLGFWELLEYIGRREGWWRVVVPCVWQRAAWRRACAAC